MFMEKKETVLKEKILKLFGLKRDWRIPKR
jgi:hypothetical protein